MRRAKYLFTASIVIITLFRMFYGIGIYLSELTSPKLPQVEKAINAIEPKDR